MENFFAPIQEPDLSPDLEVAVGRMFELSGVSRDEVVFAIEDLPRPLNGFWLEPFSVNSYHGFALYSEHPTKSKVCVARHTLGNIDEFLRILAHELEHYIQWRDGRVAEFTHLDLARTKGKIWDGAQHLGGAKDYFAYLADPWEVGARRAEIRMLRLYTEKYGSLHPGITLVA